MKTILHLKNSHLFQMNKKFNNPKTPKLFPSPWTPGGISFEPPSSFLIIDHRSINVVCMCRSTNYLWICTIIYYVLCLTNVVAMVACHDNHGNHIDGSFCEHIAKNEEKGHSLSHFYNIDHR